ncbi:hypothetical protein AgCh_032028 [Apium graveolens]
MGKGLGLEIAAMADSFIPVSADHSEPSVGGPSSDSRPVLPPVLAILPPVVTAVPLRVIPPVISGISHLNKRKRFKEKEITVGISHPKKEKIHKDGVTLRGGLQATLKDSSVDDDNAVPIEPIGHSKLSFDTN